MSLKVIELNDKAIKVGDETGVIVKSPGFALALNKELTVGEAAEQQARLHPTNSYNKFWHELNLEPLSHENEFRHLADIAYAHLLHLAKLGEIDGDVIFAVPGNFTRQQLSILLGLAKQCPFEVVGMVDTALAAAVSAVSSAVSSKSAIYVDIQLHQVVLSKVANKEGLLKVESVIQVPGVGSQNFMELMMRLVTDLFIQQCRFNPQHDAGSEQQLYNALPSWLRQDDADKNSLLLELRTEATVHTAKMPRESLVKNLSGHYRKIAQQIDALADDGDTQLLLSAGMAELPGFIASLDDSVQIQVLDPGLINSACLDYRGHIIQEDAAVYLVDSLPVNIPDSGGKHTTSAGKPTQETVHSDSPDSPTHALYQNRAIAVGGIDIRNASQADLQVEQQTKRQLNGSAQAATSSIVLSLADLPANLGRIEKRNNDVYLDSGNQEFLLNQTRVSGKQKLTLGDRIKFTEGSDEICLIQVKNG